ncbi:leucine-rich repeat domain-containing protein [Enterococcus sp. OL5]|uniref:leucine-rich repeat domain-containing protein n=1 Tax=Enterococcus sp. OL5 TaxID=2590214 RepID=UPI00112D249C|nr:leucine-rich repeat domain-containing protein [Enterococcus sp. OL5]TPR55075.1 hypothetical protein FJU10_18780 [Enterococcus sp. OL5]
MKKVVRILMLSLIFLAQIVLPITVIAETIEDRPIEVISPEASVESSDTIKEKGDQTREEVESNSLDEQLPIEVNTNNEDEEWELDVSTNTYSIKDESDIEDPQNDNLVDLEEYITADDLGNEKWLMDEVTAQAQLLYPGTSVENNNIPKSFLLKINRIELTGNQIAGEIPDSIGNLVNLTTLNLRENQIAGEIPDSIGNLVNLTTLELLANNLSGEIPESIGNLVELRTLNLRGNRLTGEIPTSVGGMRNLEYLYLHTNNLIGKIPANIANLTNLKVLELQSNMLEGEIYSEISSLKHLQVLNLRENNIDGTIPESIGDLTDLTTFNVNNTNLEGKIPNNLKNLINLRVFGVSGTNLGGDVSILFEFWHNIEEIWIADTAMVGALPSHIVAHITRVSAGNSGITIDSDGFFDGGLLENTFARTGNSKWLNGAGQINGLDTIKPFDSTHETYFSLHYENSRGGKGELFEEHTFSIYAGDIDKENLIYEGQSDVNLIFKNIVTDYYTIVLDNAENNPNNVTRIYNSTNRLTAETIGQTIMLGEKLTENKINNMLKNVKFDGELLDPNTFDINLVEKPNDSIVGDHKVDVILTYESMQRVFEVPLEVKWGSTLLTRGLGNWTSGAFTYHPDQNIVTARLGLDDGDGMVNPHFERVYYSFSFHHLENERELLSSNNRYYSHEVNGTEGRFEAINKFGESTGEVKTSVGDVIAVYHAEADTRLGLFSDEVESNVSTHENTAYFELTSSGYKLLTFERAVPVPATIQAGMTTIELDGNVSKYLDLSATENVSIVGFMEYPDTTNTGQSSGIIRVEEELSTGQFVVYDYEVPFSVETGRLKFSEVNADFDFGEMKQSSRSQTVSAKGEEAPTITISDYSDATQWEVNVSAHPFSNSEGQELQKATITLNDLRVVETVHTVLGVPTREIRLSQVPQSIGVMVNPNGVFGEEHGQSVIQIGEVNNGSLTGVALELPANTPMDDGEYQTTITWELVGDPTMGGRQ